MQLVGVKRKYDEMEGVTEGDGTATAAPTPSAASYPVQRQSILNISMFKLRTPPCKKEPSLRRSVLIFNTLRYIEQELKQEGFKFMPPPPPIVFPPAEQDMTLDPPPTPTTDATACPVEDFAESDSECVDMDTIPSSPLACSDSHLASCSSLMASSDVLTTSASTSSCTIQCDMSSSVLTSSSLSSLTSSSCITPLPSISTLSSSCPLPPVTTFMESSAHRLSSAAAAATSCSTTNLSSISDVLLNSVPVLNSTPVATPSKDGPLSPPSSSDSSMSQLFDLDTKVSSSATPSQQQVLPPPSSDSDCSMQLRSPNLVTTVSHPRQHHLTNGMHNNSVSQAGGGPGGYSGLFGSSFTATAAISLSPPSVGVGGASPYGSSAVSTTNPHNNSNSYNTAFSDVDMSLYDFDLLTSPAPNVKVAPLSAEELMHSFPADSYSGSIGPSPCYKTDFLGDDLDHIMQILVGI